MKNGYKYINKKRVDCHAGHQMFSMCHSRGESKASFAYMNEQFVMAESGCN